MYLNGFKNKRGRPALNAERYVARQSSTSNIIQALRTSNIINEHNYQCALSFQTLYRRYLISINAPYLSHTSWDSVGMRPETRGYHYGTIETKEDLKIKKLWFKINSHLRSKLTTHYDQFIKYILHSDSEISHRIMQSQRIIDILREGIHYLTG